MVSKKANQAKSSAQSPSDTRLRLLHAGRARQSQLAWLTPGLQDAIDQFTAWYCPELRLASNRIVVVRYRLHMESRGLPANAIDQQVAASH